MTKDETTQEESTDQPSKESMQTDQPKEESQDQPSTEVEEDIDDANEEEEEEELAVEIDGEEIPLEELKKGYLREKDYRQKTQKLAEERRGLQAPQQPTQSKTLTPEEEEVVQARQTLKRYGFDTGEEVDAKIRASQTETQLSTEFGKFQEEYKVDPEIAALVRVAGNAYKMSYKDAYEKFWLKGKRPVKRKIVGASKKAQSPVSGKGGGVITRADIAGMSKEEYEKNLPLIEELYRKGELK